MGTSENRDCQWASRNVLKDFTKDALTISACSLFQNGTARIVKANWRRRLQHRCWWNLLAWPRSPLRVRCAKVGAMGNSRRPWVILNMAIRFPRIRRCVRENRRNCLRAASYGTCRSPFTNCRASFCTFSSASASRHRMGCLNSVFKVWLDKRFVQGEKNIGGKGREGSFQVKQRPTRFIGSADDIIFRTEAGI